MLLEKIVKCGFGPHCGIVLLCIAPAGVPVPGIQRKPVAEICPLRFGGFFGLTLGAAHREIMTAVFT